MEYQYENNLIIITWSWVKFLQIFRNSWQNHDVDDLVKHWQFVGDDWQQFFLHVREYFWTSTAREAFGVNMRTILDKYENDLEQTWERSWTNMRTILNKYENNHRPLWWRCHRHLCPLTWKASPKSSPHPWTPDLNKLIAI